MVINSRIMADEQENAFDNRVESESEISRDLNAAAKPEIETSENPEEEFDKKPDEDTQWEGEYHESGCPIWMDYYGNLGCGRKLHIAPDGIDEESVCLMHSKDPGKQSGSLFEAFKQEFERVLGEAGENDAHFEGFVFPGLNLSERTFRAVCLLSDTTFTQDADFYEAIFEKNADFSDATFEKNADFSSVTFTQEAGFHNATFAQEAQFSIATFTQDANFSHAIFTQEADFSFATFTQAVHFLTTEFHGAADFHCSRFLHRAEFLHTEFDPRIAGQPSAMFDGANFSNPGEIVFDGVDLGRVLFQNCDVSQVSFTSSVQWARRKGGRGLAVFDEAVPTEQDSSDELQDGHRDHCAYCAAEQIYHQLKKNYDSRLDYWTANEFHFSEMEMRRLAGPTGGPLLGLRRWRYRNLSVVAFYRWFSDYGNSYRKPMELLIAFVLLFAVLLPLPEVGLKRDHALYAETYTSVWHKADLWTPNLWAEARLLGKSAIASVDIATFQKSAEYTPAYPWGRVLAIAETLLTSTLFGLFLLAIRRQFKR